jgi:DNA-binding transcriptional ArsR family regulator
MMRAEVDVDHDVFRAVADPTRRTILDRLARGEIPAGDLASGFDMTQAAVSQHLKVLRDAGLVGVRAEGRRRLYGLRAERLREVDDWVSTYRRFWEERLDALGRLLDEEGPCGR